MGEAQTPPGGYGRNLQPDRYTKVQHKSTHSVIPAVPTLKLANLRGLLGVVLLLRHCLLVSVVMICTIPQHLRTQSSSSHQALGTPQAASWASWSKFTAAADSI